MKSTKQCERTGVNAKLLKAAVNVWSKERMRSGLPIDRQPKRPSAAIRSVLSYVASLPPPPMYGSSYYYKCISYWYQCYQQASYLDGYSGQIASLQQAVTNGEIALTAHLESYASCIGGMPA